MRNLIIEFTDHTPWEGGHTVLVVSPSGEASFVVADYKPGIGFFTEHMEYVANAVAWGRHPSQKVVTEWLRLNAEEQNEPSF
jgi:hypothetical protein